MSDKEDYWKLSDRVDDQAYRIMREAVQTIVTRPTPKSELAAVRARIAEDEKDLRDASSLVASALAFKIAKDKKYLADAENDNEIIGEVYEARGPECESGDLKVWDKFYETFKNWRALRLIDMKTKTQSGDSWTSSLSDWKGKANGLRDFETAFMRREDEIRERQGVGPKVRPKKPADPRLVATMSMSDSKMPDVIPSPPAPSVSKTPVSPGTPGAPAGSSRVPIPPASAKAIAQHSTWIRLLAVSAVVAIGSYLILKKDPS